jgi:hypothetical protein
VTFFCSAYLKESLKGKRFEDVKTIEHDVMKQLLAVPKIAFEMCFQHLQEHWNKCIHAEGTYFERY